MAADAEVVMNEEDLMGDDFAAPVDLTNDPDKPVYPKLNISFGDSVCYRLYML